MKLEPKIATGKFVPGGTKPIDIQLREAKEKYKEKQQRRHDWFIAMFSVIGGGIMGFITSLIFWWITK